MALEATTGWRFVVEELHAVGARVHLAEPAETAALRGSKKRAKSDRADARHLRQLLMAGRLPESWIPPDHILDLRARVRLRHTLSEQRGEWQQRIQSVLYHHGCPQRGDLMNRDGLAWLAAQVGATGLALYGRKLWETMSSHWPTADQQPGATPAEIEFARRWRDMPKVVFSSTTSTVDWNTRLVTGDGVTEITRLKADDGGPMDIGGATLAAAAMRAGLIDEYAIVTHPVLVGGGTPFFTALDNWVNLTLVETRTFPDGVVLTRYETRR